METNLKNKTTKYNSHYLHYTQFKTDSTCIEMIHRESPFIIERPVLKYDTKDLIDNIDRLPESDQEMVNLYYYGRLTQKEMSQQLNKSQGDISYRLHRINSRLKFLFSSDINDSEIDLLKISPIKKSILITMIQTGNYLESSRRLNLKPGRIRYQFLLVTQFLKNKSHKLYKTCQEIINNHSILTPVRYR